MSDELAGSWSSCVAPVRWKPQSTARSAPAASHGGESYAAVEDAFAKVTTTHQRMGLSDFDDAGLGPGLLGWLNTKGRWAGNDLQNCKTGAHIGFFGDLRGLIEDPERLARSVVRG